MNLVIHFDSHDRLGSLIRSYEFFLGKDLNLLPKILFPDYILNTICDFKVDFKLTRELGVEVGSKTNRFEYDSRFSEFIELFANIGADTRLFPKKCSTCGRVYSSFPHYIHNTEPLAQCLKDYSDALDVPRTMQYRNCRCGSTLTIIFTKEVYPLLDKFWEMLGKVSKENGQPLDEVVSEFREQCNRFVIDHGPSETE